MSHSGLNDPFLVVPHEILNIMEEVVSVSKNTDQKGKLLTLYVTSPLKQYNLPIQIAEESSISHLHQKILYQFEQKQAKFRGLKGLKITQIKKVNKLLETNNDKDGVLPNQGKVGEFVSDYDQLEFRIESFDIWLHIKLNMSFPVKDSLNFAELGNQKRNDTISFDVELDLKVECFMPLSQFVMLLQKLSIEVWNQVCQNMLPNDLKNKALLFNSSIIGSSLSEISDIPFSRQELDEAQKMFVLNDFFVQANEEILHSTLPNFSEIPSLRVKDVVSH